MLKRSEICCYRMTFGYVVGEFYEFLAELWKMDVGGMWSELLDVYSCFMVWLSDISGLDLYIINNKSTKEWKRRWAWWKEWLAGWGLEFYNEYMRHGSNYHRGNKRKTILIEAIDDQFDIGWNAFAKHYVDGGYLFNDKGEIASVVLEDGGFNDMAVIFDKEEHIKGWDSLD